MSEYPNEGYRRNMSSRDFPRPVGPISDWGQPLDSYGIGGAPRPAGTTITPERRLGFQEPQQARDTYKGVRNIGSGANDVDAFGYQAMPRIDVPFNMPPANDNNVRTTDTPPKHLEVKPASEAQRAAGGFEKMPWWKIGKRLNLWLQLLLAYYQWLDAQYGAKRPIDLTGWILNCGGGGGTLVGTPGPCGNFVVMSRAGPAGWDENVGHATLVLGNWWASYFPPPITVGPTTVTTPGVGAVYRKPDVGKIESPQPWTIEDPRRFDMRPKPKQRFESRKDRDYNPMRSIDPFVIPVGGIEAEYDPIPYWMIPYRTPNRFYAPTEQSVVGYGPALSRDGRRTELPKPGFIVDPSNPNFVPNPTFTIDPSVRPPIHVAPPALATKFARPGKKTKEAKMAIYARGLPVAIYNVTTEFEDFIDAIWKALPFALRYDALREKIGEKAYNAALAKRIKNKDTRLPQKPAHVTPQQKMRDLYENLHKVDWDKAMKNLVENEIEDRVFGAVGRAAGASSRRLGLSHGIQLGGAL